MVSGSAVGRVEGGMGDGGRHDAGGAVRGGGGDGARPQDREPGRRGLGRATRVSQHLSTEQRSRSWSSKAHLYEPSNLWRSLTRFLPSPPSDAVSPLPRLQDRLLSAHRPLLDVFSSHLLVLHRLEDALVRIIRDLILVLVEVDDDDPLLPVHRRLLNRCELRIKHLLLCVSATKRDREKQGTEASSAFGSPHTSEGAIGERGRQVN